MAMLRFIKKKGRKVQAAHVWDTGWQILEFDSRKDFDKAKERVEKKGGKP